MSGQYTYPFAAFELLPKITPELMKGQTRTPKQRLQAALNDAGETLQQSSIKYEAACHSLQTAQAQYRKAQRNADNKAWSLETALRSTPRTTNTLVPAAVAPAIKAHAHADELRRKAFAARQRAEEDELEAKSALTAARSAEADASRNLDFYVETGVDLSRDGVRMYGV